MYNSFHMWSLIVCPKIWHCHLRLFLKKEPFSVSPPWGHHYPMEFSWVLIPEQLLNSVLFEAWPNQICIQRKNNQQKQTSRLAAALTYISFFVAQEFRPCIEKWQILLSEGEGNDRPGQHLSPPCQGLNDKGRTVMCLSQQIVKDGGLESEPVVTQALWDVTKQQGCPAV